MSNLGAQYNKRKQNYDSHTILGTIFNSKLQLNLHIENTQQRVTKALWTCNSLFGKNREYPMIGYFVCTGQPTNNLRFTALVLQKNNGITKIRRLACTGIAFAIRTCPTGAFKSLLNILSFHLLV